jgi:hypothetical protein
MNIFSSIKEKIAQYIDVYLKLAKVNFIKGASNVLSYFVFVLICLFLLFCILLLLGFGLVSIFHTAGLSLVASFFITFGIYILFLLFIVGLRKHIVQFFSAAFIRMMTDDGKNAKTEE